MIEQLNVAVNRNMPSDTIFDIDFNVNIGDFIKFYLMIANRTLNHLGKHSENTQVVASAIADISELNSSDKKLLKYGSLLHDIGKLFVPAEILNSSRALNPVEFEMIKAHTTFGYEALSFFVTIPVEIKALAISHHYKNGFGYPKHFMYDFAEVSKEMVDILTIADSFSAIMEPRVYKKPVLEAEAFEVISDLGNEKNMGLSLCVLDKLKYLIDNKKIKLNSFF